MLRFPLGCALAALAAAPALAQVPAGGEFRVNTYTTDAQVGARVAMDASGGFVVAWNSLQQYVPSWSIRGQRYAADGTPAGGEFQVAASGSTLPAVAHGPNGFMVVWNGPGAPGFDVYARRYRPDGSPRGAEFVVNTYTGGNEYRPKVAPLPGGGFVICWSGHVYGAFDRIMARRYDSFGIPMEADFQVSLMGSHPNFPATASAADGRFVVVWQETAVTGSGIAVRLYDAAGNAAGPQFFAEVAPGLGHRWPDVAMAADGTFVVVWEQLDVGSGYDIHGRAFTAAGAPLTGEFKANAVTSGDQHLPLVAAGRSGDFVIAWTSGPSSSQDVVARRFGRDGQPRGGDFRVNTYTTGEQGLEGLAMDAVGNFVATWASADGGDWGVFAQRFGGLVPAALLLDTAPGQSDGNGVLEPGETVDLRPAWRNVNGAAQTFSGTLSGFDGPAGATYALTDGGGSYGTVPDGAVGPCTDCYAVGVSAATPRPLRHWDTWAWEEIAPAAQGQRKVWYFHVGDTFSDVPRSSLYYRFVETLVHNYVTAGCTEPEYCPQASTTREQMAVFVLVSRDRAGDPPPLCTTPLFGDVPASSAYCRWIEELARSGVVTGCGGGNFCPSAPVSREQMAVFVLRAFDPALDPPACATPMFADVPASSPFCRWIEELARRGVVTGCGGGNYCPTDPVTREQMAVFLTAAFGLRLYGV